MQAVRSGAKRHYTDSKTLMNVDDVKSTYVLSMMCLASSKQVASSSISVMSLPLFKGKCS